MSSLIDPFNHRNYREPEYNPFARPSPNDDITVAEQSPFDLDNDSPFQFDYDDDNNKDNDNDKLLNIKKELNLTKQTTLDALEKAVTRDTELDRLIDKSGQLVHHSFSFKTVSKKLKYHMWCDNLQKKTCLIVTILIIITIIILIIVETVKNNSNH